MAFGLSEGVAYPVYFMQQIFFAMLLTEQPKKDSPHSLFHHSTAFFSFVPLRFFLTPS